MSAKTAVSEIMSTNLVTITKDDTLKKVSEILESKRLHHIPVVDGNKLVGIISMTDFMRLSMGATLSEAGEDFDNDAVNNIIYDSLKVGEVMTANPATVSPDTTIKDAADLFELNMFHAIPVVENGELKGMISTYDIIKHLLKE
jgi:acetoin utilization protein AcuB